MKRRTFIITEKDFEKYGIESHYDLDMGMDWSKGGGSKKPRTRKRKTKRTEKTVKSGKTKGISKVKGEDTGRIIKGFASTTHKDRAMDVIVPDAMKEAVNDLVQEGANTVFLNHDTNIAIGRVLKTELRKKGIFVEIMISKASDVEDIWVKIKEGVLNAFSIRLKPKKVEVVENQETGRIEEFRILSMELFEVSVVGLPMNAKAAITSVIEKSFNRSIKRYNTKKRSSVMKNKNAKKKGRRKSAPAGVTADQVKEMIAEANAPVADALKGIQELLVAKSKPAKKKSASKKKSKKTEEVDPMIEVMKQMQETNAALVKSLKRSNRRKGGSQDDDAGGDNGVPAKVLKDATDADTVKYCLYAASHQKAYDELTEEERRMVKGVYVQCMTASELV
jgi:HK97 family phage prohead protease